MASSEAAANSVTPPAFAGPFPVVPRVVYQKNPLFEVVCQLRFPPILRIETELPAAFQEQVRSAFPMYVGGGAQAPNFKGLDLPKEVADLLRSGFPAVMEQPQTFVSQDELWKATLNKEFVALTTPKYERWEQFAEHLTMLLDALEKVYEPAFYTRIGLRYRNRINPKILNLSDKSWTNLLRPELVGELGVSELVGSIDQVSRKALIRLARPGTKVQVRHGLERMEGEVNYLIDNDFHTNERTKRTDAFGILEYFHREAHNLFRWSVSEQLHAAMGPEPIK